MAKRSYVSRGKDRKIFARTAKRTKKINVSPNVRRGGITL